MIGMSRIWRGHQRREWAAFVFLGILLGGCASVDPAPFVQFSSSVQALRASSDPHAKAYAERSKSKLSRDIASGDLQAADLQLSFTGPFGSAYGFAEKEPTFVKVERFRTGFAALNDALAIYAQSLVLLAGGSSQGDIIPTKGQFTQMAKDLNGNARAATAALRIEAAPDGGALLSVAAITLFESYIRHRRGVELADAINEVQPTISEFATKAANAARILASDVRKDYNTDKFPQLADKQSVDVGNILVLNETTQTTLAALKVLSNSYKQLPNAHQDLALATSRSPGLLAGLTAFNQEANRLVDLVAELRKINAVAAANSAKAAAAR